MTLQLQIRLRSRDWKSRYTRFTVSRKEYIIDLDSRLHFMKYNDDIFDTKCVHQYGPLVDQCPQIWTSGP